MSTLNLWQTPRTIFRLFHSHRQGLSVHHFFGLPEPRCLKQRGESQQIYLSQPIKILTNTLPLKPSTHKLFLKYAFLLPLHLGQALPKTLQEHRH